MIPAARKKLVMILLGSLAGVVILGVVFSLTIKGLSHSEFFQISSLVIEGNQQVNKAELIKLSGLDIYSNLLSIDTENVRSKIEIHPWIEWAVVKKKWPHALNVHVEERVPLAIILTEAGLYYIDKNAVIFAPVTTGGEDLDYPVINGKRVLASETSKGVVAAVDEEIVRECLELIRFASDGSSSFPRQNISQIYVDKEERLILFLADKAFPIYLGADVTSEKYRRLKKVLTWLYKKKEFAAVEYIRLDYFENKVLVGKNNS